MLKEELSKQDYKLQIAIMMIEKLSGKTIDLDSIVDNLLKKEGLGNKTENNEIGENITKNKIGDSINDKIDDINENNEIVENKKIVD
jgi:hypothetical protein